MLRTQGPIVLNSQQPKGSQTFHGIPDTALFFFFFHFATFFFFFSILLDSQERVH